MFDLDGTLVDDASFRRDAWSRLALKIGALMTESVFHSFDGMKSEDVLARLVGRSLGPSLAEALERDWDATYRELYRPHVAPAPGASELLARLRAAGIKIGLATSLGAESRAMVLDALGWHSAFDAVVASEGLPGKPEPDVFIAAARALDVPPAECLAFEDSWNGVTAAVTAGMTVVGITSTVDAEVLLRGGARYTIGELTKLPPQIDLS